MIKYIVIIAVGLCLYILEGNTYYVIDGDTLKIGLQTVRLAGIDAPEIKQNCVCGGKTVKCGQESAKHLSDMIKGTHVSCRAQERDYYGRIVAECFIIKNGKEISLNYQMVKNGWAKPPSAKYFSPYRETADRAEKRKAGFWACERFEDAADFRKSSH